MNLRILTEAEDEIESARRYLNRQVPGLGKRSLNDLDGTLNVIPARPMSFPKLETLKGDHPCRRAILKVFSYVVIFEVLEHEIVVVTVAHSSRAPNYWLSRHG